MDIHDRVSNNLKLNCWRVRQVCDHDKFTPSNLKFQYSFKTRIFSICSSPIRHLILHNCFCFLWMEIPLAPETNNSRDVCFGTERSLL